MRADLRASASCCPSAPATGAAKAFEDRRCFARSTLGCPVNPALRTGSATTTRECAMEGEMPALWLMAPYLLAAIWWTYSPLEDWLYFAQALRIPS